jgi:hypothetical protein
MKKLKKFWLEFGKIVGFLMVFIILVYLSIYFGKIFINTITNTHGTLDNTLFVEYTSMILGFSSLLVSIFVIITGFFSYSAFKNREQKLKLEII